MTLTTYITDEQDIYEVRVAMKAIVRKAIFNTLVYEGFDSDAEVSVTFVDNERIKELNSSYRNKDSATDVLSFPLYDDFSEIIENECSVPLGDIVISLEKAARQGHKAAQYNLGVFYYNGQNVAKDIERAAYWWEKSANQNDADSQFSLANCYEKGLGLEQSMEKAKYWYKRVAIQGHQIAKNVLNMLLG